MQTEPVNSPPIVASTDLVNPGSLQSLKALFEPKSIAVIGASEQKDSVGRALLENLLDKTFGGVVYPINPNYASILDHQSYPNLASLPGPVDLAIIVTPAITVPEIIRQCVESKVKTAVIVSSGFKEIGPEGAQLEQQIIEEAQRGGLRLLGPNCLGIIIPRTGLNATFVTQKAQPGQVAFISQSGALCSAVLDWSLQENVGFSAFISIGAMADIGWGDLIDYLGNDSATKSIVIYMETIGDARAFVSAAREVTLTKPIIVIKAGRTEAGTRAAASHTGTLTGSDEVLDAAFRRCGVMRVTTIGELFNLAEVLAMQPRPRGPHLTILTNAGGPGVLATDALIGGGGELTTLSEQTKEALSQILPQHWSHNNPVDILGDATPERYAKVLEILAKEPNSNGLLVVLTPQVMTDPLQTAEHLKAYAKIPGKPLLTSWMGGTRVAESNAILNQANIPTYPYPDTAVRVFNHMWHYQYNLKGLYETPMLPSDTDYSAARTDTRELIAAARQSGRTLLNEVESKNILAAYGIPTVETRLATSEKEAISLARELGYPVVLKLYSQTITHKSAVGGVQLYLTGVRAVQRAYRAIEATVSKKVGPEHFQGVTVQPMINLDNGYELILGSSLDPQFGPILLFGSGGRLVEVSQDHALGLPPLNSTLARRMMEQTHIFKALQAGRGGGDPLDLAGLEQILVQFSQLIVEQKFIKEVDINPLLASPGKLIALDARIVLHDPEVSLADLPRLAIRPYPTRYVQPWTLKNGIPVVIRPIRPEDEPLMVKFHEGLSERSVYFRYLHMIGLNQRTDHDRLTRICFIDYDREMALVGDYTDPQTGQHEIVGVGRLTKLHGKNEGEFAVLINDRFQRQGLGLELLSRLLQIGRDEKLSRIVGDIHPENRGMQKVCEKLGFKRHYSIENQLVEVDIDL